MDFIRFLSLKIVFHGPIVRFSPFVHTTWVLHFVFFSFFPRFPNQNRYEVFLFVNISILHWFSDTSNGFVCIFFILFFFDYVIIVGIPPFDFLITQLNFYPSLVTCYWHKKKEKICRKFKMLNSIQGKMIFERVFTSVGIDAVFLSLSVQHLCLYIYKPHQYMSK